MHTVPDKHIKAVDISRTMPEDPSNSIAKAVSSTFKRLKYGKKNDEEAVAAMIQRQEIELPRCWEGKFVFVLHNVFTKQECQNIIKDSERRGYSLALVGAADGKLIKQTDARNNYQNFWDSDEMAKKLHHRLKAYLPELWRDHRLVGLNDKLRIQRYDAGQYFKPHFDASYRRDNGERSFLSIQLFLNQDFRGGNTTFLDLHESEKTEIEPTTGSVLIYQHDILHEDSKLLSGRKYTLRTDIMYSAERIEDFRELRKLRKKDKGKFGMST